MTVDGMVPADEWAQTGVHKASSYSCGKCGEQFASPDEIYEHLDSVHAPKRAKRRKKVVAGERD